jgi:UDP-N-acetylmuramoyl-L-alanyl-D-glutamate--2,6-diaminopimelate ligase
MATHPKNLMLLGSLEAILKSAQACPGVIGTINYRFNDKKLEAINTTPDADHFQHVIKQMKDAGVTHVIPEISSHGLTLKRVWNLDVNTAVFTNLTQDHLDFHDGFEEYYEAKKLLFSKLLKESSKKNKSAIINIDDKYGQKLLSELKELSKSSFKLYSFSLENKEADFHTENLEVTLNGSSFTLVTPTGKTYLSTPLIGFHNISNILAAVAPALIQNISPQIISKTISELKTIPGRLDKIHTDIKKHIFVDYAHTPDALENVLTGLAKVAVNKIITVFGCGGDRDRTKRPLMGEIAAKYSDTAIVTSDNPRTEDPTQIIDDIIPGITKITDDYIRIEDRRAAIEKSIDIAGTDDIVLIAGKGHEDYQILGKKKIHFSDKEVVEEYLK